MKRIYFKNPIAAEDKLHLEVAVEKDEEGDYLWKSPQDSTYDSGVAIWYKLMMSKKTDLDTFSNNIWYYPGGEPKQDVPETVHAPSCQHEYVDVGFMHPKLACKFCDKEKDNEEA